MPGGAATVKIYVCMYVYLVRYVCISRTLNLVVLNVLVRGEVV